MSRFTGAVLTGGGSRRMGRDKAFIEIDGTALATIVARSHLTAGAKEVLAIGGDLEALGQLEGFNRVVADKTPGEGPLGGIISALHAAQEDIVVVLACDTPEIDSRTPLALVDALERNADAFVAYAVNGGQAQPLTAAWRRSVVLPTLEAAFAQGERAPRGVLELVTRVEVTSLPSSAIRDVDRPADLDRYASNSQIPSELNED